jgi:CheY-like chemotaxis protein
MDGVNILLVEDNEGDILLTREAFEDAEIPVTMNVVRNGEQAIHFLNKREKFKEMPTPDMILLDINLPKLNGIEVLKYIKEHERYKKIPVVMLTTSSSKRDIQASYENYVNSYITKPLDVSDFMNAITTIEKFWLKTNQLPPK